MHDMTVSADPIVIVDGARTPIGRFGGALADVPAHELGGVAAREALRRAGVEPDRVGEVIMGIIGQVGPDAYNSRRVAFAAGLDKRVPAFTVNRLCGSGLQAIWSGAQELAWGGVDVVLAGGNESMSRMPFLDFAARGNARLGDRTLVDGTIAMLTDPFSRRHMGVTAENVASRYEVTRQQQDAFAAESQRRAGTAAARAVFAEEIVPVGDVAVDEHPRPDTTLDKLAALKPAFADGGTVTAGNASGINDGAAAVVLARASTVRAEGWHGLATLNAVTTAAMEPELMGYAPVLALRALFERTGLTPEDIGVIELNEAFASQAVAVIRDAALDPQRVNPYGGAIALGHPVGATGAILTLRTAMELHRNDHRYGVVTMCIGGGQALAGLLERWDG